MPRKKTGKHDITHRELQGKITAEAFEDNQEVTRAVNNYKGGNFFAKVVNAVKAKDKVVIDAMEKKGYTYKENENGNIEWFRITEGVDNQTQRAVHVDPNQEVDGDSDSMQTPNSEELDIHRNDPKQEQIDVLKMTLDNMEAYYNELLKEQGEELEQVKAQISEKDEKYRIVVKKLMEQNSNATKAMENTGTGTQEPEVKQEVKTPEDDGDGAAIAGGPEIRPARLPPPEPEPEPQQQQQQQKSSTNPTDANEQQIKAEEEKTVLQKFFTDPKMSTMDAI